MTKKMQEPLTRLQDWYLAQCNGDWEHLYGIVIDNIDNPGWSLKIDLLETVLFEKSFDEIEIQRKDEHDWYFCSVEEYKFVAYGGPKNLEEMVNVFLNWANEHEGVT